MNYNGKMLARARDRLDRRRRENQEEHSRRQEQVYKRVPEIRQIDGQLRTQIGRLVRIAVSREPNVKEQIAALQEENLGLQARRAELLVEHGLPMDYLDEICDCKLCGDTGTKKDGSVCSCLEKLYKQELTKEMGVLLREGDERFEQFDLNLYPDDGSTSPRKVMAVTYSICKRFADCFPNVTTSLLLSGAPGLGKTFLSACIARQVADTGCSVCYDTAVSALEPFERQKFARSAEEREEAQEKIDRMLTCDLMILDDLGTELITDMSQSALYTLLNTRIRTGRRMIISTNFSREELESRYTPQICSRLLGEFTLVPFAGSDLRQRKK